MPSGPRGDRRDDPIGSRRRTTGVALLLAAAVIAVYGQVYAFGFVELDDPGYVSANPIVAAGLTWDGIAWAFSTGHMWNWSPVTWLSLQLDVQCFGVDPGAHHLVNLALHLANTLLLLALLVRTTGALWPSAVVAALFGLHPLHVESVAWISERKDVLSTLFFLLTLSAYASYARTGSRRSYAAALLCCALGLMAKAMLVTVPFVLLLFDVWPLERVRLAPPARSAARPNRRQPAAPSRATSPLRLLVEKIPFFALAALFSVVTYLVQQGAGAMEDSGALPLSLRIANATLAYVRYLVLAVWPARLAVFYPYDFTLPTGSVLAAAAVLVGASGLALRCARDCSYVTVGWFWYLGTLVPVIGLVQVGSQAYADRYTYVPLIGIFIALAWGGRALVARWGLPRPAVATVVATIIAAYAVAAFVQVRLWRSGETLLRHAVAVTQGNYLAHNNLGVALLAAGRTDEAIAQYRAALQFKPDYAHARANLAAAMLERYQAALAARPDDAAAHYDLATALRDSGRVDAARAEFAAAIRLDPAHAAARRDLGAVLVELGEIEPAIAQLEQAARLLPNDATLAFNLGSALARAGRFGDAASQYRRAIQLTPEDAEAWGNLAMAAAALGNDAEARAAQQQSVRLARAQGNFALAQTMDDWMRAYRSGAPAP
ncbi:MAG: tetratricopeptide repeat protein [Deltaproteobacteria bacterium]|nr:tetratricopeptide repeat protein [Deltaproteobacteria bacterium]